MNKSNSLQSLVNNLDVDDVLQVNVLSQRIIGYSFNFVKKYKHLFRVSDEMQDAAMVGATNVIQNVLDGRYGHHGSFGKYMNSILHNSIIADFNHRMAKKRKLYSLIDPEMLHIMSQDLHHEEYQEDPRAKALYDSCMTAMSDWNETDKMLFELKFVQGMEYKQIATELNLRSDGAARTKLSRLKTNLKKSLEEYV